MAMAPTQQRMVILAEEPKEEKAEEPKEEATEPAEETKLEEVNQEKAEPLVPVEKEKKYRRIRVKKTYSKKRPFQKYNWSETQGNSSLELKIGPHT